MIQYWKFPDREKANTTPKTGEDPSRVIKPEYDRAQVFFANVFNAEQVSGLPPAGCAAEKA